MRVFITSALMLSFLSLGYSISATKTKARPFVYRDELPVIKRKYNRITRMIEQIYITITSSKVKKIQKRVQIAEINLARLHALTLPLAKEGADTLFSEYGSQIKMAYLDLTSLILQDDELATTLELMIVMAEDKLSKVNPDVTLFISNELKKTIIEDIIEAKITVISHITKQAPLLSLLNKGFFLHDLIKLQAISDLTGESLLDLVNIEQVIYNDNQINYRVLLSRLGLTNYELNLKLHEYQNDYNTI